MSSDREVLLALYRATGGPEWRFNEGWNTNADISSWYGVKVRDGHVVGLDLRRNNLKGPIPKELAQLTSLEELSLSKNQLNGPIPKELAQLTSLEKLYLSDNQLNGSIPKKLGQLTSLRHLNLSGNKLDGSIPKELGLPLAVPVKLLGKSQLTVATGSIPKELGQLTSLTYLNLSNNKLDSK